ncbi:hypothetical protein INT44_006719 [Umbelopsis vinacea]|uniref:Uncharacterized protein n=1 Tax=Umbelopsis vinacea TaxID=44442 RepID=A0A8H7U7M9_9FUNG|nr:hypothetical protein INT44_006719 [Umbelopsis vinacea]
MISPSRPFFGRSTPSPTTPTYPETTETTRAYSLETVKHWKERDVADWLESLNYGQFTQKFIENNINGEVLLELDNPTLKEMDIKTVGERVRILTAVRHLRQGCYNEMAYFARMAKEQSANESRGQQGAFSTPYHPNISLMTLDSISRYESTAPGPPASASIIERPANKLLDYKPSVQRSNSFSRLLGRSDSKRSQKINGQELPTSPKHPNAKRSSQEGNIMSMEKVKQTCVRVFGEDGQTRIVNVHNASDVRSIMSKVLHKFGVEEANISKYCIFVGSSDTGAARALSDEELEEICRSQDRPEKERLILRKRHQYPTHEEFKRKGTITQKRNQIQKMYEETAVPWAPSMGPSGTPSPIGAYASLQPLHHGLPDRQQTVDIITSIGNGMAKPTPPVSGKASSDPSTTTSYFPPGERSNDSTAATQQSSNWDPKAPTTPQSGGTSVSSRFSVASFNSSHAGYRSHTPKLRQFFGERPPSEVISSNLPSFFPNHKPEILETAGFNAKRMSMRRASHSSGMSLSRRRDSVMPELASVFGLELDKVFEQEELEALQAQEEEEDDENFEEEDAFNPPAELKLPTSFPQKTSLQNKRYSTLLTIKSDGDVESHMPARKSSLINTDTTIADKAAQYIKASLNTPVSASLTLVGTPTEAAPEVVEIPSPEPSPTEPSPTEPVIHVNAAPVEWMKGSLIGRGTFGDVYLGLSPISGELMAVKQVELPVVNSATEDRKRTMISALEQEIALLRDLHHENIVQYLGFQCDDAHFSIFLEYVPGGSVAGLLASYGAFKEPLVCSFVRQILKGLNYLHGRDIIHRDIKGANVLVDNKGGVKISDFGISKKVEDDMMLVSGASANRPSLQGSVFWMAPEVVKQTQYTRKADIWSLGCMVVEMFTGDHPFPEFSQMQAIFQIGSYQAPNIPDHIGDDAKDFLNRTFDLDYRERPTADVLLQHPFLASVGTNL